MLASVAYQMHGNSFVGDAFESETDTNALRSARTVIRKNAWGPDRSLPPQ
jgi:hypothetical protein